jgi:hypothetical protein
LRVQAADRVDVLAAAVEDDIEFFLGFLALET